MKKLKIVVLPGDGIGFEVMDVCLDIVNKVIAPYDSFQLEYAHYEAGAVCYQKTGNALPDETLAASKAADAILLGAMGLPSVRYEDGTEIAPQLDLRFEMELYAGVRPVKCFDRLPLPLNNPGKKPIDFVLIRESTEGLFSSRGKGEIINDEQGRDTMVITRRISEKLFDFCFGLARQRKQQGHPGVVTCVDKANVFKSMAFMRKVFFERAEHFKDIEYNCAYVDATALNMVKQPWNMDVLVTENMFGDILSDLGAGLMGGMGMAPSADIGDNNAVFQPCHGTAPDIVGQGKANPTAMILSAAMMLEWLAVQHDLPDCQAAADKINQAVDKVFTETDLLPMELGGNAGTKQIADAVESALM